MADKIRPGNSSSGAQVPERHLRVIVLYWIITVAIVLLLNMPGFRDYVGSDNDDTMRLVQVRDLLAGQSWFDLNQYRLGLEGGTLMHWSRLVDLPIALLIAFFSLFFSALQAEAVALTLWPLLLSLPLMACMAIAVRRLDDRIAMHVALMLTAVFVITGSRFLPGSIDHHNLQAVIVAAIAAGLLDTRLRIGSYVAVGVACAFAMAIGAETAPLIAVVCAIIACLWVFHGARLNSAVRAFSLALLVSLTLLFVATIPPSQYGLVTCDSLSVGYYAILATGAAGLFIASFLPAGLGHFGRWLTLAVIGILVASSAVIVAPQCLQNPLNELDPLLHEFWLSGVVEARSLWQQLHEEVATVGAFYAAGVFAAAVCVFRILDKDRVIQHAILLAMLCICLLVSVVQVRGSLFTNLLAIIPLSSLIGQLRQKNNDEPENLGAGLLFALSALLAVPSVWALGGVLVVEGTAGVSTRLKEMFVSTPPSTGGAACATSAAFAALAKQPAGTVSAPSDLGADILRYTHHRVLTGPYHRNQAGMLTELHIGLSTPKEAAAFLRGGNVKLLIFCFEGQTERIAMSKPDGLYAALGAGTVPPYLVPVPIDGPSAMKLFHVVLP